MRWLKYLIGYTVLRRALQGDALFVGVFMLCMVAGVIFTVIFVLVGYVVLSLL